MLEDGEWKILEKMIAKASQSLEIKIPLSVDRVAGVVTRTDVVNER